MLASPRGTTLLDTLIALAILGMIGTAFLTALPTGSRASGTVDEHVKARTLALRNGLESFPVG